MTSARPRQPSLALWTDLYELTMLQAYLEEGLQDAAVFSLFVRRLPAGRNYLIACGLDDVLRYLEELRFDRPALDYLASLGLFSDPFLRALEAFRFEGDVFAMPEGTPVFANEPLLEIVAPLPQGQIVETFALNQYTLQTMLASKASRVVTAARGRTVVDFGLRRMHGLDAGLKSARAFYIAGVDATSNVAAGQVYGIPVQGTMAHSYIQAHDDEYDAFRRFAQRYGATVLLVDTYDTIAAIHEVVALARELGPSFAVRAVRLDSGDLDVLAREARQILDAAGLRSVEIFASGGLDEERIDDLLRRGAPIDGFGVGSDMAVSADAPTLDTVYKLVEFRGRGRTKLSSGKGVLPGRKQVFRIDGVDSRDDADSRDAVDGIDRVDRVNVDGASVDGVRGDGAAHDVIALVDERLPGRPLLHQVMRAGRRLADATVSLDEARARTRDELARLPRHVRALAPATPPYRVEISPALQRAHAELIAAASPSSPSPSPSPCE